MFLVRDPIQLLIELLFGLSLDLEDVPLHQLHDDLVLHGHVPEQVELDARLEVTAVRTDSPSVTTDSLIIVC